MYSYTDGLPIDNLLSFREMYPYVHVHVHKVLKRLCPCRLTPCSLRSELLTKGSRFAPPARCCEGVLFGNFLAIAMKISLTFMAVLADVSINNKLFSSAYTWASCNTQRERSNDYIPDSP